MITMAGPQCDVCGDFILLEPAMEMFTVQGIEAQLCCHVACRPAVEQGDWTKLPGGPLRKAFEEANR